MPVISCFGGIADHTGGNQQHHENECGHAEDDILLGRFFSGKRKHYYFSFQTLWCLLPVLYA